MNNIYLLFFCGAAARYNEKEASNKADKHIGCESVRTRRRGIIVAKEDDKSYNQPGEDEQFEEKEEEGEKQIFIVKDDAYKDSNDDCGDAAKSHNEKPCVKREKGERSGLAAV